MLKAEAEATRAAIVRSPNFILIEWRIERVFGERLRSGRIQGDLDYPTPFVSLSIRIELNSSTLIFLSKLALH